MRELAAIAALLAVAASAPGLQPGKWRIVTVPDTATLDGRKLGDLPYSPPPPAEVCMSAAEAADPAAWFTREAAEGCTVSRRSVSGGTVAIDGLCPPFAAGLPAGTMRFIGRWSPTRYTVRFVTEASGENGRMGFSGTARGERIGECPNG